MNELIGIFQNIRIQNWIDIGIVILIIITFKIISSPIAYFIIKIFNMKKKKEKIKKNSFYKPLKLFIVTLGIYLSTYVLPLPSEIMAIITKIFKLMVILLLANGFANALTPQSTFFKKLQASDRYNGNDAAVNFVCKAIKIVVYIIAACLIITDLGYNIGSLVTALGISSVVVALAVQDIAKSVIAGMAILFDKPFGVGDFVEIAGFTGTVEDISFRSTKIRTLDDTVLSIPNNTITEKAIINYAKMEKRRYKFDLVLTYDTTLEKVQETIDKIKFMLKSNENVIKDSEQVHLEKIADDGVGITVYFYTNIVAYNDYLEFKEQINLAILDILEKEQVELAYNTRTVHIKQ